MDWHIDDVLFSPFPQLEVVFTIDNTSNCLTKWCNSHDFENEEVVAVETEPNSALIIPAGGAIHKVSPLKYGKRTIIKFAYVQEKSNFINKVTKLSKRG